MEEKKEEYFRKYIQKREEYQTNIKVSSTNASYEIKEKMEIYDKKEKGNFINDILKFYEQKLNDTTRNGEVDETLRKIQRKNLKKEMDSFLTNPDFNSQDVFKKHKDFIFTIGNPMSGDTIRSIRREIHSTLGIKIVPTKLYQIVKI